MVRVVLRKMAKVALQKKGKAANQAAVRRNQVVAHRNPEAVLLSQVQAALRNPAAQVRRHRQALHSKSKWRVRLMRLLSKSRRRQLRH